MFLAPSKLISLQRQSNGFGFTLRHFVVYPPELIKKSSEVRASIVVRITSDTLTLSPLMFPRSLTILMSGQRLFLKISKFFILKSVVNNQYNQNAHCEAANHGPSQDLEKPECD